MLATFSSYFESENSAFSRQCAVPNGCVCTMLNKKEYKIVKVKCRNDNDGNGSCHSFYCSSAMRHADKNRERGKK